MFRILPRLVLLAGAYAVQPVAVAAQGEGAGEPLFAVHQQPAIPLVTLRMSLQVDDPPGFAGAGHLIQHLQYAELQNQAQVVGAQVQIERTPDAIVYSVTGPAAELHYLARILRSTLQPPRVGAGARLTAEHQLAEERLAEWETAGRHLRAALRGRLVPTDISAAGTESSARRLAAEPLDELWARMYRPGRLAILAVGDVGIGEVRQEFADLPPAAEIDTDGAPADTVSLVPLAPAEATRGWFGVGYVVDDLDPAAVSVTAWLMAAALRERLPSGESVGEHWWTHHGQALVVIATLPHRLDNSDPQPALPEIGPLLAVLPSTLLGELTEGQVSSAARALRHDMLFYSRTPERMAEVIGQFIDRGGDADSAQRFYAELAEVDASDVREVLNHLVDSSAVRVDLPPQELNVTR
jgi:predicted Zn-dependent peptidase